LSSVDSADDLVILLTLFGKRNGTNVQLDVEADGAGGIIGGFAPELGMFIDFVKLHG
jgi:hypothetical protein